LSKDDREETIGVILRPSGVILRPSGVILSLSKDDREGTIGVILSLSKDDQTSPHNFSRGAQPKANRFELTLPFSRGTNP
jgi:hypothetical protein